MIKPLVLSPFAMIGYVIIVIMTIPALFYPVWLVLDVIRAPYGENMISLVFTEGYPGLFLLLGYVAVGIASVFFVARKLYRTKLLDARSHFVISLFSVTAVAGFFVYRHFLVIY